MSTPFCPQCGDPLRCACGIARHDAGAGRAAAPAQFDREWIRPYIAPHEPAPADAPTAMNTVTVSWVAAPVSHESATPPGDDAFGQPVVMTRLAGHRAHRPTKRRRPLRVTAALATLIGSAAIAGTYAFARNQGAGETTAQAPASRLDVLDVEDEPSTSPEASRSRGPHPSRPPRTPPTAGNSPVRTPSSAAPSEPTAGTPTATDAAPAAGQHSGSPSTTPPAPASPTAPSEKRTLRRHDTGPEVVDLQRRLAQLGLWSLPLRGRYDQHLDDAAQRFQAKYGVRGDPPGVYGPATRQRLESLTS
ncbi:peptidoglycan-binding protein (plasmid) [Streptomyces goshikiensis]|uniref:Peptidoglycan-binding protein n=2 Tax=Streptomyces TaxID=1883 RepID=A0ABZ1RY39_9ACTN|nr:peptidoglycan-binding domain-containing protein [Streptomyces goshikiensis]RPK29116.1 putative peptidoglycan binding domain protein [Streptomyces sp. ADI91-18]